MKDEFERDNSVIQRIMQLCLQVHGLASFAYFAQIHVHF